MFIIKKKCLNKIVLRHFIHSVAVCDVEDVHVGVKDFCDIEFKTTLNDNLTLKFDKCSNKPYNTRWNNWKKLFISNSLVVLG